MLSRADPRHVQAAVPAAITQLPQAIRLPLQGRGLAGFTLAELLVSIGVLVLLVMLATQLLNNVATITTLGNKRMDADSQARQVLDRMALDFTQMVKRSDVNYYLKSSGAATDCITCGPALHVGNDLAIFYSMVPGYYPSDSYQSPISLVAYRVNSVKMERLGKGLAWNGASSGWTPVLFLPETFLGEFFSTAASDYEIIGPQVFRFEYCYLLNNGNLSVTPWYTTTSVGGMQDVAAVVVDIAVIDPKSKVLLQDAQITSLGGQLVDYSASMAPGQLRAQWQNTLNANTSLPRPAISGIRLYERYFYLSPPTLRTP